jgi:hypothetical protein
MSVESIVPRGMAGPRLGTIERIGVAQFTDCHVDLGLSEVLSLDLSHCSPQCAPSQV